MLEVDKRINRKSEKKDLIPSHCEIPGCGYSKFVTRHRIKPGRDGGKYVPGNVVGVCLNHHAECEAGMIPKELLFEIVFNRLSKR